MSTAPLRHTLHTKTYQFATGVERIARLTKACDAVTVEEALKQNLNVCRLVKLRALVDGRNGTTRTVVTFVPLSADCIAVQIATQHAALVGLVLRRYRSTQRRQVHSSRRRSLRVAFVSSGYAEETVYAVQWANDFREALPKGQWA